MKNKVKFRILIAIFSSLLVVVCFIFSIIFSVRPSYAKSVVNISAETDGVDIYFSGEGVSWNGNKYELEPGSTVTIQVVNHSKLFSSLFKISFARSVTFALSFTSLGN